MVLMVLEVLEVLKFLMVRATYRLLAGSWQETECECLLELLAALTGAVRNLSVLSGGINNLLMYIDILFIILILQTYYKKKSCFNYYILSII
jgi:hypothetical protein